MTYILDDEVAPKLCEAGTVAGAYPYLFEEGTGRPIVGVLLFCKLFNRLDADLMVIAHEITHALVRSSSLSAVLSLRSAFLQSRSDTL